MNIHKHFILLVIAVTMIYAAQTHTAKVIKSIDAGGYTYIQVQEQAQTYWIAMTQRKLKTGETITYNEEGWFSKFHSKTLNRTFDKILFASDATAQTAPTLKQIVEPNILHSKLQTKNSLTIAQLFQNRDNYAGKKVSVRAKVTKVSKDIMKRNWVHLEDGTRFAGMDDLVFTTTKQTPNVGEIVTATGTLVKDKDFGYGYFYPVIVEDAEFKLK